MKKIAYEEYSLIFTHSYVDEDGERTMLDEPVKVVYAYPSGGQGMIPPVPVCLNEMLDNMRGYILRKVGE
jgi:hypothetical protein